MSASMSISVIGFPLASWIGLLSISRVDVFSAGYDEPGFDDNGGGGVADDDGLIVIGFRPVAVGVDASGRLIAKGVRAGFLGIVSCTVASRNGKLTMDLVYLSLFAL